MGIEIDRKAVGLSIVKYCTDRLREVLATKLPTVVRKIREEIGAALDKSFEWASLHSSNPLSLRQELGIEDPSILIHIVDQMKASLKTSKLDGAIKENVQSFSSVIEFLAIPSDYQDLLDLPQASYISYSKRKKGPINLSNEGEETGTRIDWLRYILLEGTKPIFPAHIIHYSKPISLSRAGYALMKPGGQYSVPPQFAGTVGNNFITRALQKHDMNAKIADIIKKEILEAL